MHNQKRMHRMIGMLMTICVLLSVTMVAAPASAAQTGRVNANALYLRDEASLAGNKLDLMGKDDMVTILGTVGDWYKVNYEGLTGYCAAEFILVDAGVSSNSADDGYLELGSRGQAVTLVQQYLINHGYTALAPDGIFGPKTETAVMGFQQDNALDADGIVGPKTMQKLEKAPSSASSSRSSAADSESSLLKLGSRGQAVVALQTALKGKGYALTADGIFGAKTQQMLMAFQRDYGLTIDGIAGPKTLNALYAKDSVKKSSDANAGNTSNTEAKSTTAAVTAEGVQMMDWFGGVENIFKRGDIATITDVRTGISWKEKRMGGTYHADCEPLTAEDTAAMKKAYGGTWSWDRRPVWVEVNGYKFAASINGMPHMGWTIQDNNFDGHHCIHFKNSKVHATNAKCTKHQACVLEAYNASK